MKKIDDIKVDLVNSKWLSFNKIDLEEDPLIQALSKALKKDEVVYSIVTGNIILEDKKLAKESHKLAKLQEKQAKSGKPLTKDTEKTMDEIANSLAEVKTPGAAIVVMTDARVITIYQDLNKDYKVKVSKKNIEDIQELNASEDPDEQGLFNFSINFGKVIVNVVTDNETNIKHFEFTLDQLIEIEAQKELAKQSEHSETKVAKESKPKKSNKPVKKVAKKPAAKKTTKKVEKKSKPAGAKKASRKSANKKATKPVAKKSADKKANKAVAKNKKASKPVKNQKPKQPKKPSQFGKNVAKRFKSDLKVIKSFNWVWLLIVALMGIGIIITSAIMYGTNWEDKYWIPAAAVELAFAVIAFAFVLLSMIPGFTKHKFDRNKGFTLILLAFVFIVSIIAITKTNYSAIEFIEYIITIIGAWVAFDNLHAILYPYVKKLASMTPAQRQAAKAKRAKDRAKNKEKRAKAKKVAAAKAAKAKARKKAQKERARKAKEKAKREKELAKQRAAKEKQLAAEKAAKEKAAKEAAEKAKAEKEAARKAKQRAAADAKAAREAKAKARAEKAKASKPAANKPATKKPAAKKTTKKSVAKKPAAKKSTKQSTEKQRRLTYEELLRENNKLRNKLEEVTTQFEMVAPKKKAKKAKAKK